MEKRSRLMNPVRVTLVPSHPAEGWPSMNRYWCSLAECIRNYSEPEFSFHCPLKEPASIGTRREGKLKLGLIKKISYPLKVRFGATSGIAHILDHSYAFLLDAVPAGVKKIVTVHDIIPLREPEGLSSSSIQRFRRRVECVKQADLVLADSAYTKDELIELIGLDPGKIRVLPLGAEIDTAGRPEILPSTVNGEFIFSIGGFQKRKNLEILPALLAKAREQRPELKMVRAGGRLPETLVSEFALKCGPDALVELGHVSESLLASLYQAAAATIIPSFFEGFGLPVLEAMARGCPVVAAETSSLPEVGGQVALYFDPRNAGAGARQVLRILQAAQNERDSRREESLARAAEFTWNRHFSELLKIYREVNATSIS